MHDLTVPAFRRGLQNLSHLLTVAEAQCDRESLDPDQLTAARLAPDMFSLAQQVHVVTDTAKGCVYRLVGENMPSRPDVEKSFAELQQRIADTSEMVMQFQPERFDQSATRLIKLRFAGRDLALTGQAYVTQLVLPNFYFHLSLAHGILRAEGIAVGKFDFLGTLDQTQPAGA